MTGNLSRTVLRGAGARESACLPDLTKSEHICAALEIEYFFNIEINHVQKNN